MSRRYVEDQKENNPGVQVNVLEKCGTYGASAECTHIICSGFLPTKLCVYMPQVLQKIHIFPKSFTQTPGVFFQVFCISLGHVLHLYVCVWHVYSGHLPTKLFVYIPQMLWKFRIFPRSFTWTLGLFLSGFLQIPGTCAAFLHVCGIFIQAIYPPIYLCTSRRCSKNYRFFPNIYLDTNSVFSQDIYLNTMSLFPVILLLVDLKSDALENLAFFPAIYMDSRVTSLQLSIGPNHYL